MLGEIFEFMNDCFPNEKLVLQVGSVELDEKDIKEIEKRRKEETKKNTTNLEEE